MADERDPITGMSDKELKEAAEAAYAQRSHDSAWENVSVEISPSVRSVVSVRFSGGELGAVERAARDAGLSASTYIRSTALASVVVDIDRVRQAALELLRDAEQTG